MTDQPPKAKLGGSNGGFDEASYLEGSERPTTSHPGPSRDASAAFVLGIMGFATCGLLSPLALFYGHRAINAADLVGGPFSATGRSARLGQLMGLIGTTFLVIQVTLILVFGMRAWSFVTDLDWSDLDLSRSD
ncbi:MAG: hypothetical protein ACRD2C_13050 [Acidimicrobiales bacterium]